MTLLCLFVFWHVGSLADLVLCVCVCGFSCISRESILMGRCLTLVTPIRLDDKISDVRCHGGLAQMSCFVCVHHSETTPLYRSIVLSLSQVHNQCACVGKVSETCEYE